MELVKKMNSRDDKSTSPPQNLQKSFVVSSVIYSTVSDLIEHGISRSVQGNSYFQ